MSVFSQYILFENEDILHKGLYIAFSMPPDWPITDIHFMFIIMLWLQSRHSGNLQPILSNGKCGKSLIFWYTGALSLNPFNGLEGFTHPGSPCMVQLLYISNHSVRPRTTLPIRQKRLPSITLFCGKAGLFFQ